MSGEARITDVLHFPPFGYMKRVTRTDFESKYGGLWPSKRGSAFFVHDENGQPLCWGDTPELALSNKECTKRYIQVLLH